MRIILSLLVGLFLLASCGSCGCGVNVNSEEYYVNTEFLLVKKLEIPSGSKSIKEFTIRTLDKPYQYRVLSSVYMTGQSYRIKDDIYHKYEVGDKLYFDYLNRASFFTKETDIILDSEISEMDEYFDNY